MYPITIGSYNWREPVCIGIQLPTGGCVVFMYANFSLYFISGCCGLIFFLNFSTLAAVGVGSLVKLLQSARELTILFYELVDLDLLLFENGQQFICRVAYLLDVLLV